MIYSIIYNSGEEETFLSDRTWPELIEDIEDAAAEEMDQNILTYGNTSLLTMDYVKTYLERRGIDHYRLNFE